MKDVQIKLSQKECASSTEQMSKDAAVKDAQTMSLTVDCAIGRGKKETMQQRRMHESSSEKRSVPEAWSEA